MNQLNNSNDNKLEYIPEGNIYDIWTLNDSMTLASRISITNNDKQEVPVTKEILEIIKKQEIAKEKLQSFISLSEENKETLPQIHLLINKHLDYLDKNSMKQLSDKIMSIGKSTQIDLNLSSYFPLFVEYINKRLSGIRLDDETEELFENVVSKFQGEIMARQNLEQYNTNKVTTL